MSGIICWDCSISAIPALQFALLRWRNESNKDQEKNESQRNQGLWWICQRGCLRSCRLLLHQVWGRQDMNIKIAGNLLWQINDQRNLMASHIQIFQNAIMIVLGHLKSGKVKLRRTIDQGNLIAVLGKNCNAQSVRNEEKIHERLGQPDSIDYQEKANPEKFVMGNDAIEFVKIVKDQVRKRQKRISNVAEADEEHSIIWRMSMAATMNAATFMGKNFLDNQNSIKISVDLTKD